MDIWNVTIDTLMKGLILFFLFFERWNEVFMFSIFTNKLQYVIKK